MSLAQNAIMCQAGLSVRLVFLAGAIWCFPSSFNRRSLAQNAILCQAGLSARSVFLAGKNLVLPPNRRSLAQNAIFVPGWFVSQVGFLAGKNFVLPPNRRSLAQNAILCQAGLSARSVFWREKIWYYHPIGEAWHKMRFCARLVCQPGRFFGGKNLVLPPNRRSLAQNAILCGLSARSVFLAGKIWYYHPINTSDWQSSITTATR